ncbi:MULTISPECIES: hypothetical protein [Bacillus]|uniref:hypothetical protein n=1 Tax=Bacillus TaxID=1386 RepID=UPI000BF7381A|nr:MULTISPECIES: hypothetical protein [Bacillus]PFE28539.1 hypothetical protein CN279_04825 [Bacillus anthracis]PFT19426.1 hypothetical protein COK52_23225 [Bacillus thuringiensis]AXY08047.1 hypothetical protein CUC43_14990 [Bacillus thuringiensis LM1212]MBG0966538.1 hypothetical protein [Bacillus sp. SRB1LM]MBG9841383.1 hypothetical protein [Bacillus tropicus]
MQECIDCGKPISVNAEICVHCGSTRPHSDFDFIFDLVSAGVFLVGRALQLSPLIILGAFLEYIVFKEIKYSWIFWTSSAILFFIYFKYRKISVFLFPIILGIMICFMSILYGFLIGFVLLLVNYYYYKKTQ